MVMPSDIQVFVRFKEQSVFAGEEIQSIITFKNVASVSDSTTSDNKTGHSRGRAASGNAAEHLQLIGSGGVSSQTPRLAAIKSHGARKTSNSGHKTTASLTRPFTGSSALRSTSWTASPVARSRPSHNHQRSVSIISLGSPDVGNGETQTPVFPTKSQSLINHSRLASVQVLPGRTDGNYDGVSSSSDAPELQVPSRNTSDSGHGPQVSQQASPADAQFVNLSNYAGKSKNGSRQSSPSSHYFRFPYSSTKEGPTAPSSVDNAPPDTSPCATNEGRNTADSGTLDPMSGLVHATKVLAGTSMTGSNRSSVDVQSLSNQSQETLLSEQTPNAPEKHVFPSPMMRQHYRMGSTSKPKRVSESLLMGYAQVNAAFTLDGALVDQTPFEEVKRKGFLGGQGGGGVVGVRTPLNASSLFGGFNLNIIGESIGGLLGGADLSSIKEMKDVTSSRAIPLLSTPQSLLFVDLTLVPREEKSFLFRFTLPKGLPASYKGKAIKIVYNLTIGVQGIPQEKTVQAVRRINIPFKVFSGVNDDGEIFGHDLMQPYVILQDIAHTEAVESASSFPQGVSNAASKSAEAATQDFLTYVDTLLNKRRRRQSSSATLEPPKGLMKDDDGSRAKQAISRALFLSKPTPASQQSPNRFQIARNGKRIATVVLDRTLHRLGESVTASIDLSNSQTPCYSLRCTLETTEKVNSALALRSVASITRLSRRVYRSQSENTLFAERIVFSPSIPITASPTFLTSGVNLDWALRFEFVTTQVVESADEDEQSAKKSLLEGVVKDDRGSILAAVETLQCETFEVSIPITVYGDTIVAGTDDVEAVGFPI